MNSFCFSCRSCFLLSVNDSGAAEQQAQISATILLFCPLIRTGHSIYRYDVIRERNSLHLRSVIIFLHGLMGVSRRGVFAASVGLRAPQRQLDW